MVWLRGKNISLKEMETCLLQTKNIPPSLWAEAVKCASYLQHRFPDKLVVGATPFKALHGHMPNVSHLIFFIPKLGLEYPFLRERPSNPIVVNAYCWDM